MENKILKIAGENVSFVCSSRSTRSGFAHDTTLFIDGVETASATCYYYNRTWEAYRFQTVQKNAVYKAAARKRDQLLAAFKTAHGYKKMTQQRRADFENIAAADPDVTFFRAILAAL